MLVGRPAFLTIVDNLTGLNRGFHRLLILLVFDYATISETPAEGRAAALAPENKDHDKIKYSFLIRILKKTY
ncbi:hypothetical protein [Lacrimispora sp.]|uniref:hypothetical protein n=1 Tax=Lacrimispora sp. TaxID=2719234 RepID=UPI0028A9849E|nr:hypothetical protein [Lacrimispora sp.]